MTSSSAITDYKARSYDSYLNRFIQPDSIIPNPADPQAWNRYSYVVNRPTAFNDPSGHEPNWKLRGLKRDYGRYWEDVKGAWHREGGRALEEWSNRIATERALAEWALMGGGSKPHFSMTAGGTPPPPPGTPTPCGFIVGVACALATSAQATSLALQCANGRPCIGQYAAPTAMPTPTPLFYNEMNAVADYCLGRPGAGPGCGELLDQALRGSPPIINGFPNPFSGGGVGQVFEAIVGSYHLGSDLSHPYVEAPELSPQAKRNGLF